MSHLKRTRPMPGPLFFAILVCLSVMTGVLRAHDPGLSGLEVVVSDDAIAASLSIAAPDVARIAPGDTDVRSQLVELVRGAVRFSVDGEALRLNVDEVSLEDGGACLRLSLSMPQSHGRSRRLLIASEVPKRMSSGHRELITVSVNSQVIVERLVDAESPAFTVDLRSESRSTANSAWQFLKLGVHHILSGYDHLVFLAGLLLSARALRDLVVALTCFTAAHSLSLALVAAGGVHAPPSIVEPLIAASIAWVGLENLLPGRRPHRAFVVFVFGLIHGLGFGGAMTELGLGVSGADLVLALLSFNVGVEVGQLAVASCMLPLLWLVSARPVLQRRIMPLASVAIVLSGGYWLIERLA